MRSCIILFVCILLYSCSGAEHITNVECNTVKCDTVDSYLLSQYCKDTTIVYNITNVDSVRLSRPDGQLAFQVIRCQYCKGVEYVDITSSENKLIQEVIVNHKGGGVSEKFPVDTIKPYLDPFVKVNWQEFGKVFYIIK
jgi:hypothetical protein